jgi:hypothetical protein
VAAILSGPSNRRLRPLRRPRCPPRRRRPTASPAS